MDEIESVIDRTIFTHERAGSFPADGGLTVAVVGGDGPARTFARGLRARDRALPMTPRTSFPLCSLTKSFTALTATRLAGEAGLDLDAPLAARTARFRLHDSEHAAVLSLRDVLAHRAGLPSHDLFWYLSPRTEEEVGAVLPKIPPLDGGFRKRFVYGNLLYATLGHAFPELFGVSWQKAVVEEMARSIGLATPSDEVALPYVAAAAARQVDSAAVAAAGGLHASIDDLSKWLALWARAGRGPDGNQAVPASLISEATSPHMSAIEVNPLLLQGLSWIDVSELAYGLGWFIGKRGAGRVAFHPGLIDGYSHVAAVELDRRVAVAVLCNVNFTSLPGALAGALFDLLLDGRGIAVPVVDDGAIGHYRSGLFGDASVVERQGALFFEHRGHRWPFVRTGAGTARIESTAFGLPIPLEVTLDGHPRAERLYVPLSLDPRVPPALFERDQG